MYKNKFTKNAVQAIDFANKTCIRLNNTVMGLEHLFMGILSVKEGVGSKILSRLGLDPDATLQSIEDDLKIKLGNIDQNDAENIIKKVEVAEISLSEDIKQVFQKAFEFAINSGHSYIGTEHLLLGILDIQNHFFVKELDNPELDKLRINSKRVKDELENYVQYPDLNNEKIPSPQMPMPQTPQFE